MMKTRIAALALLLLASAGTQALAQEDRRQREPQAARTNEDTPRSNEARGPRSTVGEGRGRGGEGHQARPERPAGGEARGDRREARPDQRPGGEARGEGRGPGGAERRGRWAGADQPGSPGVRDRSGLSEGRRSAGGERDGGRPDGWRPDGNRGDADRRSDDGRGRADNNRGPGDNNRWRGDNDRWRGDNRDNHGRPHWDQRRYAPVYRSQQRYRGSFWRPPVGFYVHSWSYGDFLPRGWYGGSYRLNDWWNYALPMPPPGYDWVRVGDDALLIDQFTGRVFQVVRDVFW